MIRWSANNIALLLLVLAACKSSPPKDATLPFYNRPDFTPEWISPGDKAYAGIHHLPAFSFTNQLGEAVTDNTVRGNIHVACFFFTRCGSICPKMIRNMALLQEQFRDESKVKFLSYSVTPDLDSVARLRQYAEAKGIKPGKWHLLTGNQDSIYTLARKEYFAGDSIGYYQSNNEFLHTENFLLVDGQLRIRGVYTGTVELEMQRLAEDIRVLLKE